MSSASHAATDELASPRSRTSFNSDWRFTKDDPPGVGDKLNYAELKSAMLEPTGADVPDVAYAQSDFDDSKWRKLDLPHDWGIEGPFIQDEPGETAKLPYWGVGWYRKHFEVPASDQGRQLYLDVDGAMSYANVWINGHYAGGWPYGYTSWRINLTPYIRFGGENVIAIRLDNPPKSSRWYPGGGIYRNVWLVKTQPLHVAQWGTRITTPEVSEETATLKVEVTVDNRSKQRAAAKVSALIYSFSKDGKRSATPIAKTKPVTVKVAADSSATAVLSTQIPQPQLWSPEHPHLYAAQVVVSQGQFDMDECETTFGIRTIKFTPQDGFVLNGRPTKIHGVCLHHDLGALGAAFNLRARERQLEKLKELGCNAIRASHNPLEPEFLDLCDRMGFLVMDEAFDAWRMPKRDNDYHLLFDDWAERDLRAMIRRDHNHPSVVLWSLGNEIYEQRDGKNVPLAKQLADIAHEEDPTRPVNMALHVVEASTNGFQDAVDVFGYNYTPFGYEEFRQKNPEIPLIGSETSSCTSTRGEYFFPVDEADKRSGRVNYQVTSYDYSAPKWAMAPDVEFKAQDENNFVAGEFVWTGFDYLGEPTPYDTDLLATDATEMLKFTDPALERQAADDLAKFKKIRVPSRSSYFGIFDLCGFPKDRFYIYQARWRPELPMTHILPHWNWPERVGQVTPVHVYTSGDEAELFLNGRSLGRKKRGPFDYRLRWNDVVYEPGELKVVAYRNGKEWATAVVKTTGPPAALTIAADRNVIRTAIRNDGDDLSFLTVTVVDKDGNLVPRSKDPIRFTIEGPGEIVATDNGDPTSHESFQSPKRDAFNGLCLVIVRAQHGQSGTITLHAESPELERAETKIEARAGVAGEPR
ncbi:MAG: beta-galactosidase GalB [Pirellulales bacterium]